MNNNDIGRLDMTQTLALIDEARSLVAEYHGEMLNVEGSNNKDLMRRKSEISKGLLFAEHLVDLARADVMNQYHRFKGEQTPTITPTDLT